MKKLYCRATKLVHYQYIGCREVGFSRMEKKKDSFLSVSVQSTLCLGSTSAANLCIYRKSHRSHNIQFIYCIVLLCQGSPFHVQNNYPLHYFTYPYISPLMTATGKDVKIKVLVFIQ